MNRVPADAENAHSSSVESCPSLRDVHSINPTQLMARIESYEGREKKGISDVRRTFCLFVTFDLLFITLLWIIELNVSCLFSTYPQTLTLSIYSLQRWLISCSFLSKIMVFYLFKFKQFITLSFHEHSTYSTASTFIHQDMCLSYYYDNFTCSCSL